MSIFFKRNIYWSRVALATLWACFPAFLFYMLVLQLPFISRSRLGLASLLIPFLAFIAYQSVPKFRLFSLKYWLILAVGSGILATLGGIALSVYPEKSYLLSPQHTLKIKILKFDKGQTLEINRFQTSLGDISYDSFQDNNVWKREGTILALTSTSSAPLIWTGWTGDMAKLYFSGSPGVVINAIWDNQSTTIDFSQTAGFLVIQQEFAVPFWEKIVLALILWGAISYMASIVFANTQSNKTSLSNTYLPSWVGYIFLLGFILSLLILVLKAGLSWMELLLDIALASIAIMPVYLILSRTSSNKYQKLKKFWTDIKLQKFSTLLIFLFSLGLVLSIFGRSLWTEWSIIDDHEIMYFLGSDGRLSLGEVFPMLLQHTEVGQFGNYPRFRPSYFLLRLLESVAWGTNHLYWHAFRIVILIFAVSLFWLLIQPNLGWLAGGLLCAYALTFPYWADVIGRLGPSETYAVGGLPIYIWGVVTILRTGNVSQKRKYLADIAIFLGGIICIGSKENFLLLSIPSIYLAYKAIKTKELGLFLSSLGNLLLAIYVSASILTAVIRSGTDIYSNPVSPAIRIEKIIGALGAAQNLTWLSVLIGIIVILSTISLNRSVPWEKRRSVLWTQLWLAIFTIIYLSQLFFYDGAWPTNYRYDFPGLLYIPATIYVLFWLGKKLIYEENNDISTPTLKISLSLALITIILIKGYNPIIQNINDNIKATNEFTHGIETVTSLLHEHQDYALVIESGSVADYEPIASYEAFLRAYGVKNKIFLRLHGYFPETASSGQDKKLTNALSELSANGNGDLIPLDQLKTFGDKCFSLNLSGTFETECKPINLTTK